MNAQSKLDTLEIPDKLGCVEGIRAFRISRPGVLAAIGVDYIYIPQEKQIALCTTASLYPAHNAPDRNCRCGFYLVKPSALTNYLAWNGFQPYASQSIWGLCYGWGKVIEHKFGYRVQYLYPKELYFNTTMLLPKTPYNLIEVISKRYQVKCVLNPFLENYPQPAKPLSKEAEDVLNRVKALQANPVRLAKLQAIILKQDHRYKR